MASERLSRHVEHIILGGDISLRGNTPKLYKIDFLTVFQRTWNRLKTLPDRCSENHPPKKPQVWYFEDFDKNELQLV